MTMDPEERAAIVREITKYMHEQVYWLGMWDDPDYWIVGDRADGCQVLRRDAVLQRHGVGSRVGAPLRP